VPIGYGGALVPPGPVYLAANPAGGHMRGLVGLVYLPIANALQRHLGS
jgi:hypothetical protein